MLVIFIASSTPKVYIPEVQILYFDKLIHFGEFFVLGLLLMRAMTYSYPEVNIAKLTISAIMLAVLYAAFDEWHQRFIPGRRPDIADFIFDFLGLAAGAVFYTVIIRRERAVNKTV